MQIILLPIQRILLFLFKKYVGLFARNEEIKAIDNVADYLASPVAEYLHAIQK